MAEDPIARRRFLVGAGLAGASAAAGAVTSEAQAESPAAAAAPAPDPDLPAGYTTLTPTEAAFFTAAVDTFIPADELTPKGSDCGVVTFIDRELAGAWGGGAKLYRSGPFMKGKPEQGYQLSLSPREFFATGIEAVNAWSRATYKKEFDRLSNEQRNEALKALESGKAALEGANSKGFFEALYQITMEGFFSDPVHGGNKNKVSWAMLGFPGLPAVYADKIEKWRGKAYVVPPQSIQDFS
jgi:gluconate 2-dehydrogenase gamma chain